MSNMIYYSDIIEREIENFNSKVESRIEQLCLEIWESSDWKKCTILFDGNKYGNIEINYKGCYGDDYIKRCELYPNNRELDSHINDLFECVELIKYNDITFYHDFKREL